MDDREVERAEFIRKLVESANASGDAMRGMSPKAAFAFVSKIVADNEVVFGA